MKYWGDFQKYSFAMDTNKRDLFHNQFWNTVWRIEQIENAITFPLAE